MAKNIFREKSLEWISSPEQINDYIRVANPPVWMMLGALLLLLIGICVWGVFGRLETVISAAAITRDGVTTVYIKEDSGAVEEGMTVRINGDEFVISAVSSEPTPVSSDIPDYALHIGELQTGEWVYEAVLDESLKDGICLAEIVTEQVSPISFVVN
ncbi:MAG: hypothetical protein LUG52_03660 [Clostridia bacterium]|nr:hypothetical protein [Clostridia bacterium]